MLEGTLGPEAKPTAALYKPIALAAALSGLHNPASIGPLAFRVARNRFK